MQNKILKVILALILTISALAAAFFSVTTEIPVVKSDVAAGDVIVSENIDTIRMLKGNVSDAMISNSLELVGKTARVSISSNKAVLNAQLESKTISEGETQDDTVVVALPVNPSHVPVDLKQGDSINIIAYFRDGVVEGQKAWAIGFNTPAKVESITKTENNEISRIDIIIEKDMSVEIATSVSLGDIYVVKNVAENNIALQGTTAQDIYLKNFHIQVIEDNPVLVEEVYSPEIVD